MPEPLPPDQFAILMAQAGISLPPGEVEDLRHAHAKLRGMLELLRAPAPKLAAEPGFIFSVGSVEAAFSRSGASAAQQASTEK